MDAVEHHTGESESDPLAVFLQGLAEQGIAFIHAGPLSQPGNSAILQLTKLHAMECQSSGLPWPALSIPAGIWAASVLYHLCQATVCRDTAIEEIHTKCRIPCPEPRNPETDASVDLTFRHLKHIYRLGRHLSHSDPMLHLIRELGASWPLSSVGLPEVIPASLDSFLANETLCRIYRDRILEADDPSRLGDSRLDNFIRMDLGIHRHLAPALSTSLFTKASME